MIHHFKTLLIAILPLGLIACGSRKDALHEISGETMGTSFLLKWSEEEKSEDELSDALQRILGRYEAELSNWDDSSWVMRFNGQLDTEWHDAPPTVIHILEESKRIHGQTDGALDVTVSPLIELWGFGSSEVNGIPSDEDIAQVMGRVGMDQLVVDSASGRVRKLNPKLSINCSAIAKGYAVDEIAEWLQEAGLKNYLIEIGGEIRVMGHPPGKAAWTVGVREPSGDAAIIQEKVAMQSGAVATSGDYLNFTEVDGVRYSHVIDPSTGRPVKHALRSVTIIGERCGTADAMATACMVMGMARGLAWVEAIDGYEACFIEQAQSGDYRVIKTTGY